MIDGTYPLPVTGVAQLLATTVRVIKLALSYVFLALRCMSFYILRGLFATG